ncbi:hypothetical protein POM88_008339 [Heracleum sosnowskyi]|uniref:Uncharacterized protein n=1 Tax=Heracleum sosnowskyi TaxID=360622 RepID=A0AAD8N7A2_9APIA|nr:hypothetical protein POM88_008339 [Heracleum sosnowskyi]
MNHESRRFQKVSDEVRDEYLVFCPKTPRFAFPEEDNYSLRKISKLGRPCSLFQALSLIDSTSDTNLIGAKLRIPGSMYSGDQKGNDFNSGGALGKGNDDPESDDDDLYNTWLGNVGVVDIPDTLTENNATIVAPFASTNPSDFKTK